MSAKLFLDDTELEELTGYRRASEQVAWLKRNGWRYAQNRAGAPRVARSYLERRLVGEATTRDPEPVARHNFGALRVVK